VSCRRWSRGEPDGAPDADQQAQAEPFDPSRLGPDNSASRDQAAARRLLWLTRQIDRSSRQMRREWQEKLLAHRMESIFGRRFVAILENTVVCLILVLIGLIVADALLERASPTGLSVRQHEFFAWADLAVCSVFLFEFAVKLALAPNR